MFELSKYNTNAREILQDFNAYTTMEAQTFKETIIQNMDSIAKCMVERASHEQELKMTLKKLSERQLQIQQCKVQEIDKQKLEAHSSYMAKIQEVSPDESSSTSQLLEQVQNHDENDVFANVDQNAAECVDERDTLANLIANLTLDTKENKTNLPQIRKQAVRNTNVIAPGPSRNCPKHVSHQSPREKVGSNDMVHNYYLEKAKKIAQLQKDKEVNGKPSMIVLARFTYMLNVQNKT
ncbi:hypothetical protein Tco_1192155 [Tanacetum coccineum]